VFSTGANIRPPYEPERVTITPEGFRKSDMKKLYKVSIERVIMVMASDEADAIEVGMRHERDECMNDPETVTSDEVKALRDIPNEWCISLPYGGDGKTQCRDLAEALTSACSYADKT